MRTLCSFLLALLTFNAQAFDFFITRDGHQLYDGSQEFRFAGIHAPELHRIEDDAKGKCAADTRGWGQYFKWPTADEQENWIKALTKSGHKAMRIYVLSVAQTSDHLCSRETHILAPETANEMPRLNEKAMLVYDRMIALADKHQLRLVLPFIDHWEWWGGRKQLAAFYDEKEDDFYNVNSKTFAAYLHIIKLVIQRKNTITGNHYYNEKAIMAWETGNELTLTNASFLHKTAAHIKQLAPNQLVVDGTYLKINEFALDDPNVDIISNHFYTVNNNNKPETIKNNLQAIQGKKAYMVGEFGLEKASMLNDIMQTAVHYSYNGAKTVGAFIWGFRGHRHNGGFYFHKEYTGHHSYRLPGFESADSNDELVVINIVRKAIAEMNGLKSVQPLPIPEAPILRDIISHNDIRWMGAPLGKHYSIERAQDESGPWIVIGENISDGKLEFDPAQDTLFADTATLDPAKTYFYRVTATNESGISSASNIVKYRLTSNHKSEFVSAKNGQFFWRNKLYYFNGANYWYGPLLGASQTGLKRMKKELDDMKSHGIDNLRILVGAESGELAQMVKPALQYEQGKYDESLLVGLDYLLVEMKKRDMLAVLYLNNNWIWSGGMAQYLKWNGYGDIPNPFTPESSWNDYMNYTKQFHQCVGCKKAFSAHIEKVITRTNSISGDKYINDASIMSWQVANEPRVFAKDNVVHFQAWINEVVKQINELAPNQLISTGSEGSAGSVEDISVYEQIHANPSIDYLTMHVWPKNWSWYQKDAQKSSTEIAKIKASAYIQQHLAVANTLNKPIVLSEFGFPRNDESLSADSKVTFRNEFYKHVFQFVIDSKENNGVFAGTNFWGYAGIGTANSDLVADPPQEPQGLNSVFISDEDTLELIKDANIELGRF